MFSAGDHQRRKPAALVGWVAIGAAVATVAVIGLPFVQSAYRAPALHIVLETTNALIALLIGYLVYGRYRQSRRLHDLVLVLGLCTVAVANLVLTALPSAVAIGGDGEFSQWAAVAIRFVGTTLLAAAAFMSSDAPADRRRTLTVVSVVGALVGIVGTAGLIWGDRLPPTIDRAAGIGDPAGPLLVAHPVVLATHAVGGLLYALSAVAFTRRSALSGDELLRWVGAGCVLAAASRLHYLLFPSLYSDYVSTGDLLRLGFYVLLLIGAGREIRSYWDLRTRAAVLETRRRMARDLHDGLAQELSLLWSQSRALAGGAPDPAAVERIGGAASRALDEARRSIAALTRPLDEPFPRVLDQLAQDLSGRYDVKVVTEADPDVDLAPGHAEALLRIVAEAVRNAVRHGHAAQIDIALSASPLCLSITDDGHGFAVARPSRAGPTGGFGLTSMRERARAIGADLAIDSCPGEGTTVRVTWP